MFLTRDKITRLLPAKELRDARAAAQRAVADGKNSGWTMVLIPESVAVDLADFLDEPETEYVTECFHAGSALTSKQIVKLAHVIDERIMRQRSS